jgi:hypothetical protein
MHINLSVLQQRKKQTFALGLALTVLSRSGLRGGDAKGAAMAANNILDVKQTACGTTSDAAMGRGARVQAKPTQNATRLSNAHAQPGCCLLLPL